MLRSYLYTPSEDLNHRVPLQALGELLVPDRGPVSRSGFGTVVVLCILDGTSGVVSGKSVSSKYNRHLQKLTHCEQPTPCPCAYHHSCGGSHLQRDRIISAAYKPYDVKGLPHACLRKRGVQRQVFAASSRIIERTSCVATEAARLDRDPSRLARKEAPVTSTSGIVPS